MHNLFFGTAKQVVENQWLGCHLNASSKGGTLHTFLLFEKTGFKSQI